MHDIEPRAASECLQLFAAPVPASSSPRRGSGQDFDRACGVLVPREGSTYKGPASSATINHPNNQEGGPPLVSTITPSDHAPHVYTGLAGF